MHRKLDKFYEHILDEHYDKRKSVKDSGAIKDLADVLVQLAQDPTLEVKPKRHHIKALFAIQVGHL